MEKAEKRGKEIEQKAATALARAGKREETAERKLAMANRMMTEYEGTLAREVEKAKRVLQKKLQEDCGRVLRRESVKMSGTVLVLIAAYLAQLAAVLIAEKDTITAIPLWFSDRCGNGFSCKICITEKVIHMRSIRYSHMLQRKTYAWI